VDRHRRHHDEDDRCGREEEHRQRAARRVNPDYGRARAGGRPDPVHSQRDRQLGGRYARAMTHPAVVLYPSQGGTTLLRRQPRQERNNRVPARGFRGCV
jgi:hypothetical protein